MAKGMPSMMALLGLLAVAGYQNRDKISDALKGMQSRSGGTPGGVGQNDPLGGLLGGLGDMLGGGGSTGAGRSGGLAGGLGELLNTFKSSGQSETADSWVTPGVPTKGLTPREVEQAVGAENLEELSARTGLSRDELLQRLATAIPETVDRMTPDGRMPDDDQARRFFGV
jgi:uncharacterized protein YidB (DUF937 family)